MGWRVALRLEWGAGGGLMVRKACCAWSLGGLAGCCCLFAWEVDGSVRKDISTVVAGLRDLRFLIG